MIPICIDHKELIVSTATNEANMGMSRFGGHGPTPQSPSWSDSALGIDGPQRSTSRYIFTVAQIISVNVLKFHAAAVCASVLSDLASFLLFVVVGTRLETPWKSCWGPWLTARAKVMNGPFSTSLILCSIPLMSSLCRR